MQNIRDLIETILDEVQQSAQMLERTTETDTKIARARLLTITRISQVWLNTFGSAIQEVEESHRRARLMDQVFPEPSKNYTVPAPQVPTSQAPANPSPSPNIRGAWLPRNGSAIANFI